MTFPSQKDLDKKKQFKDSLIKSLSKTKEFDGQTKIDEKKICSILRSNVRKTWMQSPIRLLKLELARLPDMNPDTRTKWLCECEKCHGMFKMTDVETDHINGEFQLKTLSDSENFVKSILDVSLDDLQVFCKPCHDTKTYAERYKISFEDALIEKSIIKWIKETETKEQKHFLECLGLPNNNVKERKISYRLYLLEKEKFDCIY